MASLSSFLGSLNLRQAGAPVDIGSPLGTSEGCRSMRVSGVLFSGAQPASGAPFRPALLRAPIRLASAAIRRWLSFVISPFALENGASSEIALQKAVAAGAANTLEFGGGTFSMPSFEEIFQNTTISTVK